MSIKFVPGKGWVTDGGVNVSAGSSDLAWLQEQRAKRDGARRAMYGSYDQYMGQNNLDWLKQNVGDSWWWSVGRLGNLANDESRFWKEFGGTSDEQYGNSAEIVNRYKALIASGMNPADVQSAIWGGANLSPSTQNGGAGGGVTKPGMLPPIGNNSNNNSNNRGSIQHSARSQRKGTWGSGYSNGGYAEAERRQANPDPRPQIPRPTVDVSPNSTASNRPFEDRLWPGNGQGMMSGESEQMRKTVVSALEKKLLG